MSTPRPLFTLPLRTLSLFLVLPVLLVAGQSGAAEIVIDGSFHDWADLDPVWTDPPDDGGGVDFGRLWVAGDTNRLYVCFETGRETGLQGGNAIRLFIDADDDPETGRLVDGMGVDLEWTFGKREGRIHRPHGVKEYSRIEQSDIGLRQGPTVTSDVFEVSFTRSLPSLRLGSVVRIALYDSGAQGGDRLPDTGSGIAVALADTAPGAVVALADATSLLDAASTSAAPGNESLRGETTLREQSTGEPQTLPRRDRRDLRVLTYNVLFDGLFKRPAPFKRILRAIDPDVICFQELWSHSAQQAVDQVSLALPGAHWYGGNTEDGMIVSRYPMIRGQSIDGAGNYWALIDLPDSLYSIDLSIVSAHPPCCGNEDGRQEELDGIAAWMREIQTPGGVEIEPGTLIVIAGDMNLVGSYRQVETLVSGTIVDEERFGPSHPADWDGTALSDAMPYHLGGKDAYTWRDDRSSFAPGRLDYIVYSDSIARLSNAFILWTEELDPATLVSYDLRATDTRDASDHLPVVADFALPKSTTLPAAQD
jgi:exonuclease III